jgi:multiple sugar transport system permease protein
MRRIRFTPVVVASYGLLVATSLFALSPLLWALLTSFKIKTQVLAYPPAWLPNPFTLENYREVLLGSNMPRYLLNTLIVGLITIFIVLALSNHTAYAAARFKFRGKETILFLILTASMVPIISLLTPLYLVWTRIGLHNTYLGVSLAYAAWQVPTAIWLIRGFIEAVPREIEEAALIDGCSHWQCFYRVVLPIIQPGLAAAGILIFIFVWNDFLLATSLTITEERRLIQVGLYRYLSDLGVEWGRFTAYTVLAIMPIIIMFVALQKRLLKGLVAGAMKG